MNSRSAPGKQKTAGNDHRAGIRPNWRGFLLQFLVFTILPVTVLLLAVVIGSQALHHRAMRNLVGERDLRTIQIAASALEGGIERDAELFALIASLYASRSEDFFTAFSQDTDTADFLDGLAIFSNTGELIENIGAMHEWDQIQAGILVGDVQSKRTETVEISTVGVSASEDGANITYYLLFAIHTNTDSVLVGAESVQNLFDRFLGEVVNGTPKTQFVLAGDSQDSNVNILYQTDSVENVFLTYHQEAIDLTRTGTGQIRYDQTHAGERVNAFALVDPPGWVLIIRENWEDLAGPSLLNTQIAPLVMIPVFVLAVFLLWFGIRRIVFPLQSLEKEAADLAEGDFTAIQQSVGGIQEIQNLQNTMLNMAGKLETAQDNLHSYIGALTAGVESERKSLARDLHDDTIQSLIALNQRIQWMLVHSEGSDRTPLVELQGLAQGSIQNLRRMIRGLRPIYLEDLGLAASIEMLTREISQSGEIPVSFEMFGVERRLDSQAEIAVYRIVQEALHNVSRHSQATQACVVMDYSEEGLSVQIRDNGRGFSVLDNQALFAQNGHFGLLGMNERAELINADLAVTSAPSQGTAVSLKITHK